MKKLFSSRAFWGCFSGTLLIVAVVVIGVTLRDPASAQEAAEKKPAQKISTTTTSTTTTTTTVPPALNQPSPVNLPLLGAGQSLGSGSNNPNVALYEQRLVDLKFDPGPVDTKFDQKTMYAIQGLQKQKGIAVTGRISDTEIAILNTFQYDVPLMPHSEPFRFEVSLDKQVGIYYENHQVRLITTVSTGNGKKYAYTSKRTGRRVNSIANTPTGRYEFNRLVRGWRDGDLGRMYAPVYFNGGIAVHGYSSVPTYPASHGCVRIPMHIADYFQDIAQIGHAVYIIGSTEVPNIPDKIGGVVPPKQTTTVAPLTPDPTTPTQPPTTTTTAPTTTTTT